MGIYLEFPWTTLQTKPIESGNIVFFVFYLVLNIMVKYSSSRRRSLGSAVLKKKPNRLVNQLILASQAEIDFNTILIIHSLSKSLLWNIIICQVSWLNNFYLIIIICLLERMNLITINPVQRRSSLKINAQNLPVSVADGDHGRRLSGTPVNNKELAITPVNKTLALKKSLFCSAARKVSNSSK